MTKKISKIFLYSFVSVFLLLVSVLGYMQTGAFRSNLRSFLYEILKSDLNASLYIGEIKGNLFSGISIDTVMIYVDNAPFIESGRVEVHYRIISLLRQKINIDSLTIENPSVHLTRWKDGSWNVDHLSTNKEPDDSIPSPWMFVARKLQLSNATFHLIDSTGEYNSSTYIDGKKSINYSNIFLSGINLNALAIYSSEKLAVTLSNLSFVSPKEKFELSKLSADISYTKDSVRVSDLSIRTPKTQIKLSIQTSGVDVFSISSLLELENAPVKATIQESTVSSDDLQIFLPVLYFIKGDVKLNASFQGTFQQLNIKKLDASFANTDLHLSGTVSNIHQPEELRLNIVSSQSKIDPPDVPELLPYFDIPLYKQIGPLTMDFQFVGKPLDFVVISKIKSDAGNVTVDGEMIITEENLHYKGLFAGSNVNLEKVFENSDFASNLNTRAFIEGDGTSIDKLNSEARIEIDSSLIRGISVSSATIEAIAKERKIRTDMSINSPEGRIQTAASFDFNKEEPSYYFNGKFRECNLAAFLSNEYYLSRLSFDIEHSSSSFDVFNSASHTSLQIFPSTFREYSIDSSSAQVTVAIDSLNEKRISFLSPIADGELTGSFTFKGFLGTLKSGVDQFQKMYAYQYHVVDSEYIAQKDTIQRSISDSTINNIRYKILTKNLQPISVFFNLPMFDAQATLEGELQGNEQKAHFNGNIKMERGIILQDSTIVQIKQASLKFDNEDIPALKGHHLPLKIGIQFESDEVNVNQTSFRYPKIQIKYDGVEGNYALYSDIDTTITIGLEGTVSVHADREQFIFSKLLAKFQGYEIENTREFTATLNNRKIKVDSALFTRRDQNLLVNGSYVFGGEINAIAKITNFGINDLYFFSTSPNFRKNTLAMGGIMDATIKLTGRINDPIIDVEMNGSDLSFQNNNLGRLHSTMKYQNSNAVVGLEVISNADSITPSVTKIEGIIPVDLRFVKVDNRISQQGLDVKLTSSNMNMSALDPFIPEITNIQGQLNSELHVTGSLEEPLIDGTAFLQKGYFVFEMTGISYLTTGGLEFDKNKVTCTDFYITNLVDDYPDGRMKIGGFVLLKGFAPFEYHLNATGELLPLLDRSKTAGSTFFGTFVSSTGSGSLYFDGTFDESRIKGDIFIQQASLTFPPTQQASMYSSSGFNTVIFVDDTSKIYSDTSGTNALTIFANQLLAARKMSDRTFLDGLRYDLTIQTRGNVRVNMIFNANAGAYEELYAELNGKLILSKDENGVKLKGTINVGNESYYTFYKKFNASGSLTFLGDPQNPQLDILAAYEGTHQDPNNSNKEERVVVTLKITGTRNIPQIKIGLKTIDQSGKEIERTGEVENDAISFLLTSADGVPGKFRDELTTQDRNRISTQLTSAVGLTFVNSMLSGAVMNFVTKNNIPFVKKFEVRQVGADPDIRIGGQILDATVNIGGRVFSDVNNANISVQIPLDDKYKRNFMLEVEKKTDNFDYTIQSRTILGARIFYRFSF